MNRLNVNKRMFDNKKTSQKMLEKAKAMEEKKQTIAVKTADGIVYKKISKES